VRYSRAIATLLLLVLLEVIAAQGSDTFQNIEPQKIILAGGTNPIEIKKTIGVFDGINNVLPVTVELKYLGRYPIDIGVIEYVENNKIINCSGYKVISSLLEIYEDTNLSTHSIDLKPYSIQFSIHNLYPKNRVRFTYYIDTEQRNDFLTQTTVRFYSDDGYPDSDYRFKMSTSPSFEVTLDAKDLEVPTMAYVYLIYNIKYLGPAEIDSFNVTFDSSDPDMYMDVYPHALLKLCTTREESLTIERRVKYLNEGKYRLPGIMINNKNYAFNKTITVTSRYHVFWAYWAVIFSSLVSIIALLPGLKVLVPLFKKQKLIIRQRIRKPYHERIKDACNNKIWRIIKERKKDT
jgi:hypothetical protein